MIFNIPWTTSEILEATGGSLIAGEPESTFEKVSIDSRNIAEKDLFVAIEGERHDGHGFVEEVAATGVRGAVVAKAKAGLFDKEEFSRRGMVLIGVEDTTRALGDMAFYNRNRSGVRVIAATGSNGKTTTRKMTAAVIRRRFSAFSSKGNFNNQIGLPLSLLGLAPEHRWAVVELGANHPGEISYLARICRPDIAIVTNVGPAHLEGFGSLEGVASAKGEILDRLAPDGTAVLNADDERVAAMAGRAPGEVLFYGLSENARVRASRVEYFPMASRFALSTPKDEISVEIKAPGAFMVLNALAAASAGYLAGVEAEEIKRALEVDFKPAPGRMNVFRTESGINIVDDAYNANLESMKGALKALESMREGSRSAFVAGDMFELGEHAPALHEQLGRLAADSKISRLYAVGANASKVADGALAAGMPPEGIFVGEKEEVLEDLKQWLRPGDWALVKGSRGMRMEQIIEGLKQD